MFPYCLLQELAKRVADFNALPTAEREKLDPMEYVFKGVASKVRSK